MKPMLQLYLASEQVRQQNILGLFIIGVIGDHLYGVLYSFLMWSLQMGPY